MNALGLPELYTEFLKSPTAEMSMVYSRAWGLGAVLGLGIRI